MPTAASKKKIKNIFQTNSRTQLKFFWYISKEDGLKFLIFASHSNQVALSLQIRWQGDLRFKIDRTN